MKKRYFKEWLDVHHNIRFDCERSTLLLPGLPLNFLNGVGVTEQFVTITDYMRRINK